MPDIALTNRIVKIHLSSWRYFALLTLPPLVLAFNLLYSFASLVLLMLFLVTHYYCWRLWLDERLFTLLNKESSLAEFDEGMAQLWITARSHSAVLVIWKTPKPSRGIAIPLFSFTVCMTLSFNCCVGKA